MNNIYLVGMPGCGKTTIGNIVSKNTGMEIVDLDELIISREAKTIDELFELGEDYFRKAETEALKAVSNSDGIMVSTGGGIVTRNENITIMKATGKVIFIDASPDFIISNSSLEGRPLLKNKKKIYELYKNRIAQYRKSADFTIANDGILSDICSRLEEKVRSIFK